MTTRTMKERLGFSFLYFGPRVTEQHEPWFGRVREAGYACAEVPIIDASDAEIDWMRRVCEREGLAATCVGFAIPGHNPIAEDPAERESAVAFLARLCDKAQALGAELIAGPMHSAYGVWSDQPPTAHERARCVDVLRRAGEHAAACGVRLAIEPLNRFESYFLNTAADCDDLVRKVGHPNIVGALDTHHAHLEEDDLLQAIRRQELTLGHVQLSENHRGIPGCGQVDFGGVLSTLEEIRYDGYLVIEAFSRQDPDFGSMLRIWRDLDDGPDSVLDAGVRLVTGRS